ncbi:thiol reductant ABC exporter subunit CydD [Chlorobium ferrooxidans]|uniref:ABC transporter, transmembrane region:ABC transporter related n=1 Tax=Chlorobium ferrooxidans DSM 13031 TaxID=377431 RepID=Q0YUS3_9CHLB|nr:thiol reductant ABC exporter subunit CydD [Chlorobium ferrooxidans]EAT59960.1 ABC transporter, transmembrane region:ABC transporter related [Chlorobium ferrooxidans DSM 13031]
MNIDRRLFQLIKKERAPFILSIISGSIASGMLIAQAFYLSKIIDGAFIQKSAINNLIPLFGFFGLFSILRMLFNWSSQTEANRGTLTIRKKLFTLLTEKVGLLGPIYTRSVQSGKLSTTLLKGVEALDAYYSQYIPQIFFALFTPLLIVAAIFPDDWISGVILLATAPLIPLFMILIGKSASAMTEKQWKTMSRMSGYFLDVLQGLPTLKLFAQSREQRKSIEESGENFRQATMRVLKVAFLSSLTLELVGTIGTAVIAVGIGLRIMKGQIGFQPALFVLLLTPDFYLPLRQLGTKFHAGMEGVSASKEIFAILEQPAPLHSPGVPAIQAEPFVRYPLILNNLSYSYPGSEVAAIDNITATIAAGKTTAIIGPSGAGKSTLINLLLRFQEPASGSITMNGRPIHEIPLEEWHREISWVPQHPYLFNATLKENILLGRADASEKEISDTLEKTGLLSFVRTLPNGLETMIGEQGSRLSGGEAQRVALARAFLKNAPLLVLDEPTSHTDPELEAALRSSILELMKGRTTVVIAHRLETIMRAEQIIVVSKGRITGKGTHDELIEAGGFYRDALKLQQEECV